MLKSIVCVWCAGLAAWAAEPFGVNPAVKQIVDAVSEERIAETLKKLASFGTRNTLSPQAVAARQWILEQFKSYSPRLQVALDSYKVKKQGRITRDVELANVVAVLPGKGNPDHRLIVSGHYDTLAFVPRQGGAAPVQDVEAPAPGVDDDGSGTAAVLELARVFSQHEFRNTLVFVAFAGEEQGLIGSSLYAAKARKENQFIDGVLNNDIIGTKVAGDGTVLNNVVHVFSESPNDSPSRELARYIRDMAVRYFPAMRAEPVFRADRFSRGGDHTPFNQQGYPAVRFTSANENYSHQHNSTDTLENVSVPYLARVAKVNAAALASLALAPKAPVVMRPVTRGGLTALAPLLGRGPSGYDAQLRWVDENAEPDLAGYAIVMRSTTAPYWQEEIFAGKVNEFLMKDVSIDDRVFGVKAIDREGNESLVSAYRQVPYAHPPIETY